MGSWRALIYSAVKRTGYVVAGLCSVAVGLLYVFQDKLLYHPVLPGMERSNRHNPRGMKSPREHGIAFEDLRIETEDGLKIHAWLMRPAAGHAAVMFLIVGGITPPRACLAHTAPLGNPEFPEFLQF